MKQPITLAPGELIDADGLYEISIDQYHSDCCSEPSISSSGLRIIETKTPAHYWSGSYLNPNRIAEEPKETFDFGRAAHVLLLGEAGFRKQFSVRPDKWSDWRTNDAKAWRDGERSAGRTVLTSEQIASIQGIASSLAAHPLARDLLRGHVEQSLIFKDKATGVFLKSRPDVLSVADHMVVDLKTTADASPEAVQRAVQNYAYDMQGALVGMAMKAVLEVEMTAFALVFVEKTAPFAVNVVEVDMEWIAYARRRLRRSINTFSACIKSGIFPGYEGERVIYMPEWMRKRMDQESDVGLLPREEEVAA